MTPGQFEQIAGRIARLAATAGTNDEANHWWAESDRFAGLAELARIDPATARRQYRPTRAYEETPMTRAEYRAHVQQSCLRNRLDHIAEVTFEQIQCDVEHGNLTQAQAGQVYAATAFVEPGTRPEGEPQ